jgi:hypothetical protein
MKTRSCQECNLADWSGEKLVCTKGHKPRFYLPIGTYPHFENEWGYKRRCEDYELGSPAGIVYHIMDANKLFNYNDQVEARRK